MRAGAGRRSPPLAEVVVADLDSEDDRTHDRGQEIGDQQRDVSGQEALNGEAGRTESHHQKRAQGDVVGGTGAYGAHGLGKIAEDHGDGGDGADNVRTLHIAFVLILRPAASSPAVRSPFGRGEGGGSGDLFTNIARFSQKNGLGGRNAPAPDADASRLPLRMTGCGRRRRRGAVFMRF